MFGIPIEIVEKVVFSVIADWFSDWPNFRHTLVSLKCTFFKGEKSFNGFFRIGRGKSEYQTLSDLLLLLLTKNHLVSTLTFRAAARSRWFAAPDKPEKHESLV